MRRAEPAKRGTLYNDRITLTGNILAFVIHILFLAMFIYYDITILAVSNVGSVLYYLISFYFVHKRWYGIFFTGLFLEVTYNAILSTFILGWAANMHYFLIMMAYGVFFMPSVKRNARITTTLLAMIIYSILFVFASSGLQPLPASVTNALGLFCILSTISLIAILSFVFEAAVVEVTRDLEQSNERLRTIASIDGLTGLYNRRSGSEYLEHAIVSASKHEEPYSVVLADVDSFKAFNETYGHDCGDLVLQQVAATLAKQQATAVRWGGEEFLLFYKGCPKQVIADVERLRDEIQQQSFLYKEETLHVTLTFGLAQRATFDTVERVVKEADDHLRIGKQIGKNRVVMTSNERGGLA